jgi:hypothetical protein
MTKTLNVAVLTVLSLALGGCGGNDDAKASKAISDSIMKEQKAGGASQILDVRRKDADCIGDGLVDRIGTDKLKKYGVLSDDLTSKKSITGAGKLSAGDAKSATGVFFDCTDMEGMMRRAVGGNANIPRSMKTCIDKTLTEANLRPFLELTFQGKTAEAQKLLAGPMSKCAVGNKG